jgi:hypothetical protein
MAKATVTETDRVRQIQDKGAPGYDRQRFFDKVPFAGRREWACKRALRRRECPALEMGHR